MLLYFGLLLVVITSLFIFGYEVRRSIELKKLRQVFSPIDNKFSLEPNSCLLSNRRFRSTLSIFYFTNKELGEGVFVADAYNTWVEFKDHPKLNLKASTYKKYLDYVILDADYTYKGNLLSKTKSLELLANKCLKVKLLLKLVVDEIPHSVILGHNTMILSINHHDEELIKEIIVTMKLLE